MDHIVRHRTVLMQTEKSNYVLHTIRQQWIEAGCQQLQDTCKHMKTEQFTTEWKWVKREIKKRLSIILWKRIDNIHKIMSYNEDGSKRQAHSTKHLHKEIE